MAKKPYDDAEYLRLNEALTSAVQALLDMEGNDVALVQDIVDQAVENYEED